MATDGTHALDRHHRVLYRRIGVVAGLALVAAAVVAVARSSAVTDGLMHALRSPDWDALLYLVLSILLMQILSSAVFHRLMNQWGRVGFVEMNALVGVSTLGNYIPMQAGSIGRVAYHKAVNGIPVRSSLVAIAQALLATFIALCVLGACALIVHAMHAPWYVTLAVPLLGLPFALEPRMRVAALVLTYRAAEICVWALHSWAAFRLSGWQISGETAIGVALVGSLANLVPFIGNGLGIREWAVALAAPLITGYERDAGLAAELVGRAIDVVVAIPIGIAGFSYLVRRARTAEATRQYSEHK